MTHPPRGLSVLVVAGEASGDMHASQLCRQIEEQVSQPVQLWGSGGDRLATLGARLLASSNQLAAIGPVAAIAHLRGYCNLYRSILRQVKTQPPDLAILVDFPDFNLRLARSLRKRGVAPIVYFVSPQLWAWREWRVRQVRRAVDKMIVLLPFEVDFYRAYGIQADYFGHPLAGRRLPPRDREDFARRHCIAGTDLLVAVLPGSRRREIRAILPPVLEGAGLIDPSDQQRLQLVIAAAPGMREEIDTLVSHGFSRLKIRVVHGSEDVLAHCDYGLVKSGTATLEAALAGIPFCVLYRGSSLSWHLVRHLIKTDHFALPNLILRERAVPELIQGEVNPGAVAEVLSSFVRGDQKWETIRLKLRQVRDKLVGEDPYRDAAKSVVELLGNY